MTDEDVRALPYRQWADKKDELVASAMETRGWQPSLEGWLPSPDPNKGHYGIQWNEVFRCHKTGDLYKVTCKKGDFGGKGPYKEEEPEKVSTTMHTEGMKVSLEDLVKNR